MTTNAANGFEQAAREKKARKLAAVLWAHDFTPDDARAFDSDDWVVVATGAGVRFPSPETQALACEILQEFTVSPKEQQ